MIASLNQLFNALSGVLLRPLQDASPWIAMLVCAAVAAIVVLAIFRLATNPARIRRRKNRVLARIMEMRVYQDDPIVTFTAFGRALSANAFYLLALLPAVAASLVPLLLVLVQVHAWLGLRPLAAGEACLVTAHLAPDVSVITTPVALRTSAGLVVESPGVRQPTEHAITWRIRATAPTGKEWLDVGVGADVTRATLAVGTRLQPKAERWSGAGLMNQLLNPAANPLPLQGPIRALEIQYPAYAFSVFGHSSHWLLIFLVLSILIAWPLQRPFGVVV